MNKPQIQKSNGNELITIQKKQKKSKFKKFFSTVTAVMIASSIAMGPMTLRGEDTKKDEKSYTVKEVKEKLDNIKEKLNETQKKIEGQKAEKLKEIEETDKIIAESKRKIEEADKKIEENCKDIKKNILLATDYCSKNTCTNEQLKILNDTKKTYDAECKKLAKKSE